MFGLKAHVGVASLLLSVTLVKLLCFLSLTFLLCKSLRVILAIA